MIMKSLIVSALLSVSASETDRLSADAALADLALAQETLSRLHPGYTRYADPAELDARWAALEADAADGIDSREFYLGLAELLGMIRCDHTKAELPQAWVESRETSPVYLPFRFIAFDGRMYVDEPGETGLVRGEEILSIDGDLASQRLAGVLPFIAVDGFTDHAKWGVMASTSEELGSAFDHYDPLLNPDDAEVRLEVRGLDGAVRVTTLPRIGYAEFRALSNEARYRNFSDDGSVTVDYPAPGVAVLNVETFVNYRTPVDPQTVFAPIFAEFETRGVETLIVDNRRNGGGSTDAMIGLLSHLTRETTQVVRDVRVSSYDLDGLRDHLRSWDQMAMNPPPAFFTPREDGFYDVRPGLMETQRPFDPAPNAFEGDVVVLTSATNASGATQMIGALIDQGHVTLVGEPTGGSQEGPTAGLMYFLTLPESGVVVRVPWLLQLSDVQAPEFGQGYTPHVLAPNTYESWLEGGDPALEAAIAGARAR